MQPEPRPMEVAPMAVGNRVRRSVGKWSARGDIPGIHYDAEWQKRSWAEVKDGTVVAREAIALNNDRAPSFATTVLFDGETEPTWVRSSVLEDLGVTPPPIKETNQLTLF